MMRLVYLFVCSIMVSACASTPRSYEYASWDNMDYYDTPVVASAVATDGP
jgi:hypothetical protein